MRNESNTLSVAPAIGQLSECLEDYIEIVYNLIQEQRVARIRDIARAKRVKMSSAVSALKRLARAGLVKYEAREFVELTRAGARLASGLTRRHRFLTRFLVDVLQVNPRIAESEACSMEHTLSPQTMERFYRFSQFLETKSPGTKTVMERFRRSYLKPKRGK